MDETVRLLINIKSDIVSSGN